MTKQWWFKFEYRIWRTDTALRRCSLETRAFWLEALCIMYETDTYRLEGSLEEVARIVGCETNQVAKCAAELLRTKTADVTLGNGSVTLLSRRLKRELSAREQTRLRVQKFRCNADVTLQSKSKSKSKNKREEESANAQPRARAISDPDEWLSTLKKEPIYSHVDIDREFRKASLWIEDHPGRRLTARFFRNWIDKIEPPLIATSKQPEMSEDERKMREGILASREMFYAGYGTGN